MAEGQNKGNENQNKGQAKEQDLNQLLKVRREKLAELQEAGQDPFVITKAHEEFRELLRSSPDGPGAILVAVDVKVRERDRLQIDDTPQRRPELSLGDPCIPHGVHKGEHSRQFAHRV